ncbi:radical SAM domain protein [Methanosarcina siciliae T4/M]|uniref:Radical SAM domain protein n=2 Tax=Methanosarcina siciliae TaxID=38027 RepID=A0A0E3PHD6_9EURY|nr:hypothetical protein [Methanosarcina siciliae]AKB30313.1 radical SAM domain protein [Methanosarcina siciliae T4/M]AKB34224.1 radical SAM domain protein [Methanosarcina siciliae HI350]
MSRFDPILASKALWQIRIKKRPFVLSHGVNAKCNMRCKFCEYWKETGKEPSREEIFRLPDNAKKLGIGVYTRHFKRKLDEFFNKFIPEFNPFDV